MPTPRDVVREWFAVWAAADWDRARTLLAPGAAITVTGRRIEGFDALMDEYARRKQAHGPDFSYDLVDLLDGDRHAAAVIDLHARGRTWRQVALYEVGDGKITAIWAAEDEPA